MSVPLPPLVGTRMGDYLIESVVGRGGMATVYRARDQRLDRLVALKVLAPQLAHDPRFRDRFVRESRLVASIDHPHIIPIYEAGEANELLFIAMRFVEGRDLRNLIQAQGPMPVARANRLFAQIASALDAAHLNGLVHRDVKPANILVAGGAQSDHVYLTDFGLTKSTFSEAGLTSQGQFMGTPRYVAPEQIRGLPVDGRSDLYAFACVVYEALTGQPPFQRDTELALLYAHVSHEPPPLTPYRPDLPHMANAVMVQALAKSPTERYATCQQFVTALREAISGVDGADDDLDDGGAGAGAGRGAGGGAGGGAVAAPGRPAAGAPGGPAGAGVAGGPVMGGTRPGLPLAGAPGMHDASHPSHPSYPGPGERLPALPAPPQAPPRPGRRKGPLIGAVAILLSLAVAAFLVFDSGDKGATWKTFPGNVAAPFSFAYPGDWPSRAHADEYVVFSPSARQFEALFSVPVSSDWSVVNPILSGDAPEQASGLLVEEADTIDASDTEQVKTGLSALLPGPVAIPAEPSATSVGGRPAFRVTGTISDPGQNGTLEFTAYVVRRDDKPTALLTFFCVPSRCDKNAMEHVVSSVTFG